LESLKASTSADDRPDFRCLYCDFFLVSLTTTRFGPGLDTRLSKESSFVDPLLASLLISASLVLLALLGGVGGLSVSVLLGSLSELSDRSKISKSRQRVDAPAGVTFGRVRRLYGASLRELGVRAPSFELSPADGYSRCTSISSAGSNLIIEMGGADMILYDIL
jgi:hypothetical protein